MRPSGKILSFDRAVNSILRRPADTAVTDEDRAKASINTRPVNPVDAVARAISRARKQRVAWNSIETALLSLQQQEQNGE